MQFTISVGNHTFGAFMDENYVMWPYDAKYLARFIGCKYNILGFKK